MRFRPCYLWRVDADWVRLAPGSQQQHPFGCGPRFTDSHGEATRGQPQQAQPGHQNNQGQQPQGQNGGYDNQGGGDRFPRHRRRRHRGGGGPRPDMPNAQQDFQGDDGPDAPGNN